MRFEFDGQAVRSLRNAIYAYSETLQEGANDLYWKTALKDMEILIGRIQEYGYDAFDTREEFRNEIRQLKDCLNEYTLEYQKVSKKK